MTKHTKKKAVREIFARWCGKINQGKNPRGFLVNINQKYILTKKEKKKKPSSPTHPSP